VLGASCFFFFFFPLFEPPFTPPPPFLLQNQTARSGPSQSSPFFPPRAHRLSFSLKPLWGEFHRPLFSFPLRRRSRIDPLFPFSPPAKWGFIWVCEGVEVGGLPLLFFFFSDSKRLFFFPEIPLWRFDRWQRRVFPPPKKEKRKFPSPLVEISILMRKFGQLFFLHGQTEGGIPSFSPFFSSFYSFLQERSHSRPPLFLPPITRPRSFFPFPLQFSPFFSQGLRYGSMRVPLFPERFGAPLFFFSFSLVQWCFPWPRTRQMGFSLPSPFFSFYRGSCFFPPLCGKVVRFFRTSAFFLFPQSQILKSLGRDFFF